MKKNPITHCYCNLINPEYGCCWKCNEWSKQQKAKEIIDMLLENGQVRAVALINKNILKGKK